MLIGLFCVGYLTVKLGDVRVFGGDAYPLYARFSSVAGLGVELDEGKMARYVIDEIWIS